MTRTEILVMLFWKRTTPCLLAVILACSTHWANAKQSEGPLEGIWTVSEIVFHGHSMKNRIAGTRFDISDNTLVIDPADLDNPLYSRQKVALSVSTDGEINRIETRNLDGSLEGLSRSGIWKIEGDTLTFCIPTNADADRPDAFVSTQESKNALYIMRRSSGR
jgi:uncharacterized protein (TIGR03067 family)